MTTLRKDVTYLFLKIVRDDDPDGESTWEQFQDKRFNEVVPFQEKWDFLDSLVDGPRHVVDYYQIRNGRLYNG